MSSRKRPTISTSAPWSRSGSRCSSSPLSSTSWPACWCGAPRAALPRGCMLSSHGTISFRRRATNAFAWFLAGLAALLVVAPLLAILIYLFAKGSAALNLDFLIHTPRPAGEIGGGMANAIVGSGIILAIASLIGVPFGIGAGVYLAEYGRGTMGNFIRFTADILNGVPSIVIGIVVYSLVVVPQKHFSAFAGGVALGIMMIPTITRTTEEMLLLVPHSIREAAWGLGIPQWRATLSITLRTAFSGIVTGIMLAFARVAGETAPLLFTALGNQFWMLRPDQPMAALPLQIFNDAIAPYDDLHRQ